MRLGMLLSETLVLTFTTIYAFIGISLFYYNRKSIIIDKRRPYLAICEQLSFYLIILITIVFEPILDDPNNLMGCQVVFVFVQSTAIVLILIVLARSSFVYVSLVDKTTTQQGLDAFCKQFCMLFWTDNSILRIKNICLMATGFIAIEIMMVAIAGAVAHECTDYDYINYFDYMGLLIVAFFSVQFYRLKIADQIQMCRELQLFMVFEALAAVIIFGLAQVYGSAASVWLAVVQGIIGLTFGSYFPLFVLRKHRRKMRWSVEKDVYLDPRLVSLCRSFYCEENALFLVDLFAFRTKTLEKEVVLARYFQSNAPYLLNITEELRHRVLAGDESALVEVEKEIRLIVSQNILPYLRE